ncbi:hypothetical protein LWI29_034467 [Acer saccharum]|uniref:Uncharacterized protein n=1 Tax=Acer saccharum TaxID=4024 RepID=A0AA39T5K3_ACESA|nr:hypothetical protein LWI29_034467 [Acer saccharum]
MNMIVGLLMNKCESYTVHLSCERTGCGALTWTSTETTSDLSEKHWLWSDSGGCGGVAAASGGEGAAAAGGWSGGRRWWSGSSGCGGVAAGDAGPAVAVVVVWRPAVGAGPLAEAAMEGLPAVVV